MSLIKTLRSYKLFGFAVIDFIGTFIGAYIISELLYSKYNIPKHRAYYLIIPFGVFAHIIFNQKTPLNNMIFNPKSDYLVKLIMLVLIYKGLT
jgi:hypothetical protein